MKYLRTLAMAVIALVSVCSLDSCYREDAEEPIVYPASADGLWASSGCDLNAENQSMYLLEISNDNARFVSLSLGKGMSSITKIDDLDVQVSYSSKKGTGTIKEPGDKGAGYGFNVANESQMFVNMESGTIALTKYEGNLDEMFNSMKLAISPMVQLPNGFEGPTQYVDLDAYENPLLQGKLMAPPVPAEGIMDWVLKGLVTGASSTVAKLIIESFIEDETAKKLDEILDQMNSINSQLAALINLVHNTTYEHYLNERTNSYLNPMRNLTTEYILRIEDAWLKGGDVEAIIKEWGNRTVGGNPAYVEALNFIDYLTGTVIERKNLYQVYDMYVFNTHPWENLGYGLRESLRAADACVIAQNALMAHLYYTFGDYSDATRKKLYDDLKESVEKYRVFAENNAVERHDDQAICQIKGAHFIMPRALVERDFKTLAWFPEKTPWDFENSESAWCLVNGDTKYNCAQIYNFCISENELKAIRAYYKDSPYTNMLDVLTQEANCTLPFSESRLAGKKIMLQTQTSGSQEGQSGLNSNYYIYADSVIDAAKGFSLEKKSIGIAWLETHGFLWMERWFRQWDTYDSSQLWVRTEITSRY